MKKKSTNFKSWIQGLNSCSRFNFFRAVIFCVPFAGSPVFMQAQTATAVTFSFTGATQTFVVPSCVSTISVDIRGAQGAQASDIVPANSIGGPGGRVVGVLSVTSGQTLYINVGGVGSVSGAGGFNGGGAGGASSAGSGCQGGPAGGGGGASDIRIGGNALNNRVAVAGGGGGSGRDYCNGSCVPCGCGGSGGAGGGLSGSNGISAGACGTQYGGQNINGGIGGSATAGGAGGLGDNNGTPGTAGGLGLGGNGGAGTFDVAGGGGGGGYYGGGGGGSASSGSGVGAGGGAGGSSYIGGLTNATTASSFQTGNGVVLFSYNFNGAGVLASASSNSICLGAVVTLTAGNVISYTWTPGGSNATSQTVAPTSNTSYTVQGTNTLGCISTAILGVTVDPGLPVLTVVNTASSTGGICPTRTVQLTASGATSHTWTGNVVNGVPFAPPLPSTYIVTGINACGTTTASTSVSVHPLPNVTAVAGQPSVCSGNPVSLTGVGNATNYVWSNNVANGGNIFPGTTANYTVVGTSALGCTAQAVVGVTVVTTPQNPPIPNPPLICIGSSVTLSSSGATNYTWTGPNGTYNTASFIDTPTITSTYTLTKSNANCVNTQTVNVIVNNLPPVSAIVNPTIVCASKPGTLNAAGASNFTWTSGPPTWSATGAQVVVSPSVSTMYTVTASDGTCANTTTIFLPTNPNPTITIVPSSTAICFGQTATLTANGAIGYNWTNTTIVTNPTLSTIVESPTISTLYSVVGENSFSCTTVANQVLVVHPNPTLTISSNKPMVCEGAAANLTVTGANTYQWDANAGNATSNIVQVNPLTSTIYTVAGTFTTTQCSSTKTILTTVFLPTFAVNSPTSSCLGGTINLIASGATSYTWNGTQPFSQIAVSPPTETVYVVAATSISLGVTCISTRSVLVSIYNNPTVTAVAERTMICRGETTDLTASGAQTYTWNTNQSGDIVPVGPFNNTTYTVTGIDQNGCIGTTTVNVRVSTCFGIDEFNSSQAIHLSVFPNPNRGSLTIESTGDLELSLINQIGQEVQKIHLTKGNVHRQQINNLASGIYFLVGQGSNYKLSEKIIVEN